ncbi:hypothetical protein ACIBI9_31305 [Nonomuraea sp. NPDC050451]|uniref:hypothetical protein n=1 Tax=Nonomuraea sp. NPDC050451 TaxID=3364364 RepID=UPI00378BB1A0
MEVMFNPPTWTNVTADVKSIETRRGANRVVNPAALRYNAGNGSIVLSNNNRQYDPTNLSGPYVSAGETLVLPMRQVRIRGTYNAITYGIMRAYADSWNLDWNGPNWSQAEVPFTDGFKVLEANERLAVAPVGASENSGARITRILDSAGWPAADRDIATGNSTMQATTLAGSALTECFLVADSELGEFYVDGDGNMTFRNRHAMLLESRSNSVQATFGDGVGELQYSNNGLTLSYDHETLANRAQIARTGGTQQVASDATSISKYLTRTFNRTDLLLENDAETLAYAQWILFTSKEPELRFDAIKINPLSDPATLMAQVLGREIGDRIRILRRPPGGGTPITRDVFIRGISHKITPSTWQTTWVLQSATKYGNFFVLDSPILGLLDSQIGLGY